MKKVTLIVLVAVALNGCGLDGDYMPTIPCESDYDCPSDAYCDYYHYFCVWPEEVVVVEETEYVDQEVVYEDVGYTECVYDVDCPYADEYCYEGLCYVDAECLDDFDCGAYETCDNGWCVSDVDCFNDYDCADYQYCGTDGLCYDTQCNSSYDCPVDTTCEAGRCVVPYHQYACYNDLDCPPGYNVCSEVVCPAGESECPGLCVW